MPNGQEWDERRPSAKNGMSATQPPRSAAASTTTTAAAARAATPCGCKIFLKDLEKKATTLNVTVGTTAHDYYVRRRRAGIQSSCPKTHLKAQVGCVKHCFDAPPPPPHPTPLPFHPSPFAAPACLQTRGDIVACRRIEGAHKDKEGEVEVPTVLAVGRQVIAVEASP
jgi:hypothetical protein